MESNFLSVGTDKLGHFFEEGLVYYDIAASKGDKYATAWGYWTEGLTPPGMDAQTWTWLNTGRVNMNFAGNTNGVQNATLWGQFGDQYQGVILDPRGTASPADLEANEAGWNVWKDFMATQPGKLTFDICSYMKGKKLDHILNPNIPGALPTDKPPEKPK
jgi:hypothetical protein